MRGTAGVVVGLGLWGGCLTPPATPASDAGPGVVDGGGDGMPVPIDPSVLGNVLTLTFDGDDSASYVRDRSGGGRHGDGFDGGRIDSERAGEALTMSGTQFAAIPADPGLALGDAITLEAWVRPSGEGSFPFAILSNYASSSSPRSDYSFEVDADGRITLINTSAVAGGDQIAVSSAGPRVEAAEWTHVAVTWDGSTARFYTNGALVDETTHEGPFASAASLRSYRAGMRAGGGLGLAGDLDELKVSDRVKSLEEIAGSMMFDGRELIGACGDRFADSPEEVCDGQELCCDPARCMPVVEDPACSSLNGTCQDGRCVMGGATRVTTGLVASYEFDELVDGDTVPDHVLTPAPLDLVLEEGGPVQESGHLVLAAPTRLATSGPATKIHDACAGADEISLEAWIRPKDAVQTGPARLVTMSLGPSARNFTLAQSGDQWELRLRSGGSDAQGFPRLRSARGDVVAGRLTHLVVTAAGGERRLYVDGRLRSTAAVPGRLLDSWDATYRLGVGDELNEPVGSDIDRHWLGELHRIAIYCEALSEAEVARNLSAGPED